MTLLQLPNQKVNAAERRFVARGQAIFVERFGADYWFDDPVWNVRVFEKLDVTSEPMPARTSRGMAAWLYRCRPPLLTC